MTTSDIPIGSFWVLYFLNPHIKQKLPSLGNTLEPSWRFVINYNLPGISADQLGQEMVCGLLTMV